MTSEAIYRALAFISDEYLDNAAHSMEAGKKSRSPLGWRRIALIAACIALTGVLVILPIAKFATPDGIPFFTPTVKLSAQEIADLLNSEGMDSCGVNQYTTVSVPSPDQLKLTDLPDEKHLLIYQMDHNIQKPNQREFAQFVEDRFQRLTESAGATPLPYEIRSEDSPEGSTYFLDAELSDNVYIMGWQTTWCNRLGIYCDASEETIYLDGEQVAVDQTRSDAEIIAALSSIRDKLFTIFGESFTDAKVERYYNGYSQHGVERLCVYFYNESDHPLNAISSTPISNYILLDFDNFENYDGDIVSDDQLVQVGIRYEQLRAKPTTVCKSIAKAKTLPLEDAEKLLAKGYVFGGHSCALCMESQEAIDFSDYDYVSMEYVFETTPYPDDGEPVRCIPFYAFYKFLGNAENGEQLYAKALVPAIEISGIEEYFEQQIENHQASVTTASTQ